MYSKLLREVGSQNEEQNKRGLSEKSVCSVARRKYQRDTNFVKFVEGLDEKSLNL